MDKYTTGLLMLICLALAILLDKPIESTRAGAYAPMIQLYLIATGLLIAVDVYIL